jgi:hypothetical protein
MNDWININKQRPPHMKEIRVWIDNGHYSCERERNAVYLAFDGNIYDAEEQETLHNVTKWKLV